MALDPNEIVSQGWWSTPDDIPSSVQVPDGVERSNAFYAYYRIYRDGHREIEWYKRGTGDGKNDPILTTTGSDRSDVVPAIKTKWEQDQRTEAATARAEQGGVKPTNVYIGTNPSTGKPTEVSEWPDGHKTYDDTKVPASQQADSTWHPEGTPDGQGGYDNSRPIMVRTVNGVRETRQPTGAELKDWNEAQQRSRNPGGKTDAEIQAQQPQSTRTPDKDHPGIYVVTTKNPQTGLTETHYENAEGTTIPAPAANPAETTTPVTRNGATYIQHTVKKPDGSSDTFFTDQQGNRVQLPNEPSKGTPAEPAGAPPASTDYGQTTASLVRYRDFLNEQVRNKTLTPEDADKLMQARLTQAQAAMAEQQGVVNTQTGIYGQQITQRGQSIDDTTSRRTAAENAYSTVMTNFMPLLKYMPKGGGQAFLDLLGHGMGAALQNATNWGGQTEHPEIQMGPAAATANAAPMPGTQGTFLAGAIPPNAIGAGSVGAVPAPGAPIGQVAAGVTATNAAAVNPTGANVQAATDATMQGSNAAFGALGVPAQQAPPPAVNPAAGEPGHNPNAPVGMLPTGGSFLAPYQQQQQQPSALDQLLNDPSIPNHIVARAYEQVYGVPLSSYGMS